MPEGTGYWQRRLRRRQVLRGAALSGTGVALTAIIGCSRDDAGQTAAGRPAAQEVKRGGVFRRAGSWLTSDQGADPHTVSATTSTAWRLVYQGLVATHMTTYAVEPELAQSWEQPSPIEIVLSLRPGVRWQDKPPVNGRDLTIQDVVFSLDRVRTRDPRFAHRTILEVFDKIEAGPGNTLRLTTKEVDAPALARLAGDGIIVMAPEVVAQARGFGSPEEIVGTGAFIMTLREELVRAEAVRNPRYWKPDRPYLERIRAQQLADVQVEYSAFLAGQLESSALPDSEIKSYLAGKRPEYEVVFFPQTESHSIVPNVTRPPLNDPRVTRALRLLVDHKELLEAHYLLLNGRAQYSQAFPAALQSWDLSQDEYARLSFWKQPKDEAVREALDLLRAAGYSETNRLRPQIVTSTGSTAGFDIVAQLVQAQWRRFSAGIVDASIVTELSGVVVRRRAQGDFDYLIYGTSGAITEPDSWLTDLNTTGGSRNYGKWSDPEADRFIERQRRTLNPDERKAQVQEAVRYLAEKAPHVLTVAYDNVRAYRPYVRDAAPEGTHLRGRQYEWVWLDT